MENMDLFATALADYVTLSSSRCIQITISMETCETTVNLSHDIRIKSFLYDIFPELRLYSSEHLFLCEYFFLITIHNQICFCPSEHRNVYRIMSVECDSF